MTLLPYEGGTFSPSHWMLQSWCLARNRQKKKPVPTSQCSKNFHQTSRFYRKSNSGDLPFPNLSFLCGFHQLISLPIFQLVGAAHGDAKQDPRILLGLGLSRAGFQEGRSPSQAVVADGSEALRSGSQGGWCRSGLLLKPYFHRCVPSDTPSDVPGVTQVPARPRGWKSQGCA